MNQTTANESWLIETGDAVIQKKARSGLESLTPWEALIYCVWVADYAVRNAGDLDTAEDVYADFHQEARRLAEQLSLAYTQETFLLSKDELETEYFDRFESMCDEIKGAKPVEAVQGDRRR